MLEAGLHIEATDAAFMRGAIDGLTTERNLLTVSQWAEKRRYLPPELTSKPGRWDNNYVPFMVEIMDRMSPSDPARKIVVRKGVQITATTALLENQIGYSIDEDPSSIIYISADSELTKLGIELKVDRMLHHSGLSHLLSPPDGKSKRSGDTSTLKEFPGGFLLAVGARNPGKLRSTSARKMVLDEVDGMPLILGGIGQEEGNPITIAEMRTATYETTRKILYLSTPLKMKTSLINPLFLKGDQNYYYVPCIHCGEMQPLDWHGYTDAGKRYGIVFDLDDDGILVEESVGYCCRECQAIFRNHDKGWFLPRGEWRPHARTQEKGLVSYHVPAFLSPPGQQTWTASVYQWMKAWDVKNDRLKDRDELQTFYNLQRGLPWEERGESPTSERVREHRRMHYSEGEVPNRQAVKETGAPVVMLTCAVDVHGDRLDLEVLAWCKDRQTYSIQWLHLMGDPDCGPTEGVWAELAEIIERREWVADDGRCYRIQGTLIDVGWHEKADNVYQFCLQYSRGVYPCMGRKNPTQGSAVKEFNLSQSAGGLPLYNVTAFMYKDRLAAWLKSPWDDGKYQPCGYPNYPQDRRDDYFDQYEAEKKIEVLDPRTRRVKGYKWELTGQRANHAWDCRVYNMAVFDMLVHATCTEVLGLETMNYAAFFEYATPTCNAAGDWLSNPFSRHPQEIR
jgi:phage terminase large subunit GpA-like protein